jgi:microcystin-dependent protein
MSSPYVGEVRLVGFNFAPIGWNNCDGSVLSISQDSVLFALIGTTYGGNGTNTFALPDLRGRVPMHQGKLAGGHTYTPGMMGGQEGVTLNAQQMPLHNHLFECNSSAKSGVKAPANSAVCGGQSAYVNASPVTVMGANMLGSQGQGQAHENRQPFLVMNWVIALFGVFPSQN